MIYADNELPCQLIEQVWQFVAAECCIPLDRILPKTRLEEDLGVTGDDAKELLFAFAQRFQVKMDNIELHIRFGEEGFNLLGLFSPLWWQHTEEKVPVIVEHLVLVAADGCWSAPERMR